MRASSPLKFVRQCDRCHKAITWDDGRFEFTGCDCCQEPIDPKNHGSYNRGRFIHTGIAAARIAANPACVRVVVLDWQGESWRRYAIIDRRLALQYYRFLRRCYSKWNATMSAVCPQWGERYGGPGRGFANCPSRLRTTARRYIVVSQSGGLDI